MRFEAKSAFALGVLLPVLETYRRGVGEWRVNFTTMFEDYLAGALLLAGAWAVSRHRWFGQRLLLVAWAWMTGMITTSFIDQVEVTLRGGNLEPGNTDVLVVKALLLALSSASLIKAFQSASRPAAPNELSS
jgi:hypothetical protein